MPSSHVLFRWISPVDRMTSQIGPNGLVPATHNCGAPGNVPDIGLAPEHEHVEVVRFHLSQRALTPAEPQCPLVGQDLCAHSEPYGVYG